MEGSLAWVPYNPVVACALFTVLLVILGARRSTGQSGLLWALAGVVLQCHGRAGLGSRSGPSDDSITGALRTNSKSAHKCCPGTSEKILTIADSNFTIIVMMKEKFDEAISYAPEMHDRMNDAKGLANYNEERIEPLDPNSLWFLLNSGGSDQNRRAITL